MNNMGVLAKKASRKLLQMDTTTKNNILEEMAVELLNNMEFIRSENEKDLIKGRKNGLSPAFIDRLTLTEERIYGMAQGIRTIIGLDDPIGEILSGFRHENGMEISQIRVPLGVIGMIFESRPNVTVDAAVLSLKSGNSIILRGGSDALCSNIALAKVIIQAGEKFGLPHGAIQLIENTDRSCVNELITMNDFIDVIIPRGGKGLKQAILAGASVPVIETGAGLCHTYVDHNADLNMAIDIIINAKASRPGVCNAMETLLVHSDSISKLLPSLGEKLGDLGVEIRADERSIKYLANAIPTTDSDWNTEYLDLILSIKTVDSIDEAIKHIDTYSTKHSEAIISENYKNTQKFLREVDSAAVYINASTRFTDGGAFGFGGEIGISTQKLHARGPMGIKELTSVKYIIRGDGQIR
ncbi:glutamate-5-semialdehyde dehydrogenase [Psychrilyobacter sp. BL5]|nr:glutamate-5-semialdehyde dehydrogenase [Psychrilyobacter sp. S5]NDI78899.1 glutamate-5-semialdehyde dehydrogenase [Psychrilyobacter piezotolerans]